MRRLMISAAVAAMAAAIPAAAQEGAAQNGTAQDTADASVRSYLCTFAGKCDGETAAEETPTMAAPTTRGFRLAGPSQPTMAVPATKGFRLAGSQQGAAAPATKGLRLGGQSATAQARNTRPGRRLAAGAGRSVAQAGYAAARPAPTVGAGTRADLMLGFGYNSDRMTPVAETKARGFAKALMMPELAGKRFLIEGHTDARGNRDFNVDLSRRRAQSVADFLIAQGVARDRVEVKGVGPDEPLPGRSARAEANRRVEAVLIG